MDEQRINIGIVTHNRPVLLKKCLDSVLHASNSLNIKICVIINGFCPSSDLVLQEYPQIETIKLKTPLNPGRARNQIIDHIDNGWICFLDDDVELPEDYFQTAMEFFKLHTEINIFGGPDLAPQKPTAFQQSLALAQMTFLASAHTRYRHGGSSSQDPIYHFSKTGEELILCNLWVHSRIFLKTNIRFPNDYKRNEENILIHRLKRQGEVFVFIHKMKVFHFKKNSFKSLYQAIASSSYHRTKSFFDFPDSFHPLYLIPSLFVLYLASLCFRSDQIYLAPLILYFILSFTSSFFVILSQKKPYRFIGRVMILQVFINLSYGLGMLLAVIKESALRLQRP